MTISKKNKIYIFLVVPFEVGGLRDGGMVEECVTVVIGEGWLGEN